MFLNKKEKPKSQTPSWFRWLMLAFIAYALVNYIFKDKHHEAFKNLTQSVYSKQFGALWKSNKPGINVLKAGKGDALVCGQRAAIRFNAKLENGTYVEGSDKEKENMAFTVGSHEIMPALEQGVEAMRVGEMREIIAPPALAYSAQKLADTKLPDNQPVRFEVELVSATPPVPTSAMEMRVFEKDTGDGKPFACGDWVKLRVNLWKVDGGKIFSNMKPDEKPIAFALGSSTAPFGIEQLTLSQKPGAIRTAIIPPAYLKPLAHKAASTPQPKTIAFPGAALPKGQAIIVDLAIVQ